MDALLVFDRDGVLLREGRIPPGSAVLADAEGRIFVLSPEEVRARRSGGDRTAFQTFRLPALDGEGMVDLSNYEGQPVIINFWASWCPPCRREIPLLEELRGEMAPRGEYGYRGLPFTVVLDRDHQVVQVVYGFGTSLDPIRNALEEAMGPSPQ